MLLFHYTTQVGLLGIFSNREIWATDLRFFTDSTELRYALDLAERRIMELEQDLGSTPALALLMDVRRRLETRVETRFGSGPFVTSFTRNGDLLSQWRGYAGTGGYSIGFDVYCNSASAHRSGIELAPCIYDKSALAAEIDKTIRRYMRAYAASVSEGGSLEDLISRGHEFIQDFHDDLVGLAPRYKHSGFAEEQEWRLIVKNACVWDDLKLGFRQGKSTLIPYYGLPFQFRDDLLHLTVQEVVVGPNDNRELAEFSVRRLLSSAGFDLDTVIVRQSGVPLRDV